MLKLVHHLFKFPVFLLDCVFLLTFRSVLGFALFRVEAVQELELVLEFFLHLKLDGYRINVFHFLFPLLQLLVVDGEEVGELGPFLDLADVQDHSHNDIFECIVPADRVLVHTVILGQAQDVVTWELCALLEELVLVEEQALAKGLVLVLRDHFVQCRVGELEEPAIRLAANTDTHRVLEEDGPLVDGAALVELFKDELAALEASEDLDNAILDEVKRVRRLRRIQERDILLVLLSFQLEHQIEEHSVFKVRQILHPAEHSEDKLNLLVAVGFDRALLQEFLPFGVLRDNLGVTALLQASESVVVLRDDGRTARAIKDQRKFTEVVTVMNFVGLEALAAHMVTHLHTATATTLEEEDG